MIQDLEFFARGTSFPTKRSVSAYMTVLNVKTHGQLSWGMIIRHTTPRTMPPSVPFMQQLSSILGDSFQN